MTSTESAAASGERPAVDLLVDWDLAARTAARLAGPGPRLADGEAAQVVGELRAAAIAASPHVAGVARMSAPPGAGVLVVDRRGWAAANCDGFRGLLEPVVEESLRRRGGKRPPAALASVGSMVTGAEIGSLLGFLGSRVLGQYDPFADPGRLLLVAPNVVAVEGELGVDPRDFRLWVCLHEETHRVQFIANPWLAGYLQERIRTLAVDLMADPAEFADRLVAAARSLPELLRGQVGAGPRSSGVSPLIDALQTPEQREQLAGLTAVMSLLEGHADVVMDAVGADVVPSVATIRARFTERRAGRGTLDRLLRRLLGLDAKMHQYADGARFVREVQGAVGVDGFNAVWAQPAHLPTPTEIADPTVWVRRVHG